MKPFLAFLLVLLLALSAPAEARMHAGPNMLTAGHRIKSGPVIDTMRTSLAAAYSFRKVVPTYAGSAVKLRRTTGGVQDIGFVGSDFDVAAAATFCAATSCFVDTWYDQSGLGRNVTQATTTAQPAYIADCGNSKPCARATTNTQVLQSASVTWAAAKTTLSVVARRTAGATARCYIATKAQAFFGPNAEAGSWVITDFVTEFNAYLMAAENIWHAGIAIVDGASSLVRIDSTEAAAGTIAGSASGTINVLYNGATTCEASEVVVWDNYALTQPERAALTANQRNYGGF